VDVHEADALGRLAVTDAGLLRRELLVLDTCLSAGAPVAGYVGGGYDDDLEVGPWVASHAVCASQPALGCDCRGPRVPVGA
jgi:acetoin utilization deacetylase AcuC-like enzyme